MAAHKFISYNSSPISASESPFISVNSTTWRSIQILKESRDSKSEKNLQIQFQIKAFRVTMTLKYIIGLRKRKLLQNE